MYCSDNTHSVSSTKKIVNSDYNDQHRIFHAGSSGTRRYNVTTKTSCLSGKTPPKNTSDLMSKPDIITFNNNWFLDKISMFSLTGSAV